MWTEVKCEEVTDKSVVFTTKGGERRTVEADTVVLSVGTRPNTELYDSLEGKVPTIYKVGDCIETGRILEAINSGYPIGCKI